MTQLINRVDATGTAAGFDGSIRKALSSQLTLLGRGGTAPWIRSGWPRSAARRETRSGSRAPEQLALYTVWETRTEPIDTIVRMALPGRQRLGTPKELEAAVDTQVPNPTLTDAEAGAVGVRRAAARSRRADRARQHRAARRCDRAPYRPAGRTARAGARRNIVNRLTAGGATAWRSSSLSRHGRAS